MNSPGNSGTYTESTRAKMAGVGALTLPAGVKMGSDRTCGKLHHRSSQKDEFFG